MKSNGSRRFRLVALVAALALGSLLLHGADDKSQRTFDSPGRAADALYQAAKAGDTSELLQILGPDAREILSSGDPVSDRRDRERIVEEYKEMHRLVFEPDKKVVIYMGAENWPFPIPLVEKAGLWRFDTAKGTKEILFRRIGRNENATIDTLNALVLAQKEYASKPRGGAHVKQYAQKFISDEGRQNGLYWKKEKGQPQSPIGPLVANAAHQGYQKTSSAPVPFHGYIYRVLESQGKNAPGGAMSYMTNGQMTRGFAFVAYPVEYRDSGVMTFIVGKDGIVYQKDLGHDTARIAGMMTTFNPDKSWKIAE